MSRTTVRKYVQAEAFPERAAPPAPPSMLDPYRAYLHQWWMQGCENAAQLWREIHAAGYQGTQAQVEKWAYHRRAGAAPSTRISTVPRCQHAAAHAGLACQAHVT